MDLIKESVGRLYRRYLTAAMGGAVVLSIYSFVDTIAIGQSEGPAGAAAMAVINPLFGTMIVFSILCGIGGAVMMGSARGAGREREANEYFTAALIVMLALTALVWAVLAAFPERILALFGADESVMPMAMRYAKWIIRFCPTFMLPSFLSCFLRNDGAPGLATAAVITGGVVNMFGDWLLVFPLGMGIEGAAIATVTGSSIQIIVMCTHFFSWRCGLKLVRPKKLPQAVRRIFSAGFGSSVVDLGAVVINCIMNNRIMHYGGPAALAVYGVIATIAMLFQALFSGVGQAVQPIISANYGAGETQRIHRVRRMGLVTAAVLGVLFTLAGELFPTQIVGLFMDATPEVLAAAPRICRIYFLLFLFMGLTIVSIYHLQSVMHARTAMALAFSRSVVLSGLLLLILPAVWGLDGVWWAMPLSEGLTAAAALYCAARADCVRRPAGMPGGAG